MESNKKYISCNLIEHGFDTNIDAINFCCRSSNSGGGFKPLLSNYHGEKINWENFFKIKNAYRNQMKEGKMIEECKNCIYLEEKEWDEENYISYINFNHGMVCNSKCIYCYLDNVKDTQTPYSALPIVKDMIKNNILRVGGHVTIAGGEPTADPDFEELLSTFIDFGINPIRVLTNGIKYSAAIEKGVRIGSLTTVISVDAGTKETYYKIKGVKAFDKVWENLKKYSEAKMQAHNVKSKFIIIPGINDNKREIDLFLKKSAEAKIVEVCIDVELFWFDKNSENLPKNLFNIFNHFLEKANKLGLKVDPIDRAVVLLNTMKK